MSTMEEKITADMLYYEALYKDVERFPDVDTRFDFELVYDKLRKVKAKFNFVDDIRNEENLPEERTIHYGESNVTPN